MRTVRGVYSKNIIPDSDKTNKCSLENFPSLNRPPHPTNAYFCKSRRIFDTSFFVKSVILETNSISIPFPNIRRAICSSNPQFDGHWIPRQVIVNHAIAKLQIPSFPANFRTYQHLCLVPEIGDLFLFFLSL